MNFVIMDGFDTYPDYAGGTDGDIATEWNCVSATPTFLSPGLGGQGRCLVWSAGASTGHMQKAFTADSKLSGHFSIKVTANNADSQAEFLQIAAADGGHQFGLWLTPAGRVSLRGENAAQVAISDWVLQVNQINRVSWSADIANGIFNCSFNGDPDAGLTKTGIDINDHPTDTTGGIFINGMMASGFGSGNAYLFDDLILATGALVDFGPQELNTMPADSDIAVAWARSAGVTNFSNVDELPCTADTDYNSSSTVGDKDCFGYANPPATPESILAVALVTVARKEESAIRKFREFLRIGATDYPGTEHSLLESYGRFISIMPTNPATASTWTAPDVNALTGGYELTEVD